MALDTARLSAALRSAMLFDPVIAATNGPSLTAFCNVLAAALITEITTHAVATVDSVAGTVS